MPTFDPYYKWLGIRPKDQPPDHYRLLGLDLFEADPDVIDAAAEQRMNFINQCATGPHLAHSQRLLNEIAAARLCLLNRKEKDRYDAELMLNRGQAADDLKPVTAPQLDRPEATPTRSSPQIDADPPPARRSSRILVAGLVAVAGIAIVGCYSVWGRIFPSTATKPPLPEVIAAEEPVNAQEPASIPNLSSPTTPSDPTAVSTTELSEVDNNAALIRTDMEELAFTQGSSPTRQALTEYRLMRIGRALDGYHRDNNAFPLTSFPNEQLDAESKISWLVAMLPHLNQAPAFHAIKLDEAWNSETNQKIAQLSVPAFKNPILPEESQGFVGVSHFAGMAGVGTGSQYLPVTSPRAGVFGENRVTTVSDITDGISNTMAVAEVGSGFGPWAAGGLSTVRSLTASPYINGPDGLGGGHGMNVLMADGSVRSLSVTTDDKVVHALATIAGGDSTPVETPVEQNPISVTEPAKPKRRAGQEWGPNSAGIVFCWCPPGELIPIKVSASRQRAEPAGSPSSIPDGFWISKYEVTQAQWIQVMKSEPWKKFGKRETQPLLPATHVSWSHAEQFCKTLTGNEAGRGNLKPDRTYRLPHGMDWEYACRAGTTTLFSFGDNLTELGEYAWIRSNSNVSGFRFPHNVGLKRPNSWGLHDMYGNVSEWCVEEVATDGNKKEISPNLEKYSDRSTRGGNCIDYEQSCYSFNVNPKPAAHRDNFTGFRIVFSEPRMTAQGATPGQEIKAD